MSRPLDAGTSAISIATVNELLGSRMAELAMDLAGQPSQRGRDGWRYGNRGSLAMQVQGPKRGAWHDHEAGIGGDPLGLVAHLRHQPMREAFRWALAWLGEDRPAGRVSFEHRPLVTRGLLKSEETPPTLSTARRIWGEAQPIVGTIGEAYLVQVRGIASEGPLRFHPSCPRGWDEAARRPVELLPAMLALMTDAATGQPCGVHRTFLLPDGSGKAPPGPNGEPAKMMAGAAGVIRLSPDDQVTTGLGLAEGIETALSVMQGFGWRPVWAAASAGAIARFPVLPGLEALTIFADRDGPGLRAAEACAALWMEVGRQARIVAPPIGDWNDVHRRAA